jgi:phage N-6-adenine-methyltransferase
MQRVVRKSTEDVTLAADVVRPGVELLSLRNLRLDGGTQKRKTAADFVPPYPGVTDLDTLHEYAALMVQAGGWGPFPPVDAVEDEERNVWVWDGFHRLGALAEALRLSSNIPDTVLVKVASGSRRDAVRLACGANAQHGLRRTNADKRNSVTTFLLDPEWSQYSDREIARECKVSDRMVNQVRAELEATAKIRSQTERRGADGRVINVAPIGGKVRYVPAHEDLPPADDFPVRQVEDGNVVQSSAPASRVTMPALGVCSVCHRPLSDPEHAANGCGPVCAAKKATAAAEAQPELPVSLRPDYDGDEWYTPRRYIELAEQAMGGIDLDPCSTAAAQTVIAAGMFYDKARDGLVHMWHGRVWLNPPYSDPAPWVRKLLTAYNLGNVTAAVVLVNNATETGWFQSLLRRFPACFLSVRIAYWRPGYAEDTLARQGQTVFYLGPNEDAFWQAWNGVGIVVKNLADL